MLPVGETSRFEIDVVDSSEPLAVRFRSTLRCGQWSLMNSVYKPAIGRRSFSPRISRLRRGIRTCTARTFSRACSHDQRVMLPHVRAGAPGPMSTFTARGSSNVLITGWSGQHSVQWSVLITVLPGAATSRREFCRRQCPSGAVRSRWRSPCVRCVVGALRRRSRRRAERLSPALSPQTILNTRRHGTRSADQCHPVVLLRR